MSDEANLVDTVEAPQDQEVHLDLDKPVEEEAQDEPVTEVFADEKKNEDEADEVQTVTSGTRCPDCPLRPGLKDDYTLCPTCNGTGFVEGE